MKPMSRRVRFSVWLIKNIKHKVLNTATGMITAAYSLPAFELFYHEVIFMYQPRNGLLGIAIEEKSTVLMSSPYSHNAPSITKCQIECWLDNGSPILQTNNNNDTQCVHKPFASILCFIVLYCFCAMFLYHRNCFLIDVFQEQAQGTSFWKGLSSLAIFISLWFSVVQTLLYPWFMVLDKLIVLSVLRVCFSEIKRYKSYFRIRIILNLYICTLCYAKPCIGYTYVS